MSSVIKGIIIGGAILLTGGLAAPALFALGASTSMLAAFATAINAMALSAVLSGITAQLAGGSMPRPNVSVEYRGTVEPRRIIYGTMKVSGMDCIPAVTSGSNNKYLHQVLALCGHEVNSIGDVYFNQDVISSGSISSITGTSNDGKVTSGAYANKAWIRRYLGTSSQTADYILDNALSIWTSSHRGRGVAYLAIQYEYDEKVFKVGKPDITCIVQGKKCYDPRLDSSPGANPTNPSYIAFTSNPALCLADYLTDQSIGMGDSTSSIDWTMVATAASICDESVTTDVGTQNRYTCNVVLLATQAYEDNITMLAGAMLGSCLFSGGKWRMKAGAWESASFQITDATPVDGGVDMVTAYPYKDRWNSVRGSFVDPGNNYQPSEFPAVSNSTYVSADGEQIFKDVQFAACTDVHEAQRNAILLARKSRNRRSATIACDLSAWKVRPGETGLVTLTELGWTNQTVRCEGWKFNPAGTVELSVREESASDWSDPLTTDYTTPLAISNPTPVYYTPDAPSGLASTATNRGPNLTWTAPAVMPTGAVYEVWEYTSSTPFASATKVWEGISNSVVIPKSDTTTRYYWVRVRMADGTTGPEYPTSTAGVAGYGALLIRDDIAAYNATDIATASRATDTFSSGTWSSSSAADSSSLSVTGASGQAIEVTITAQVDVTTYAATQDLNVFLTYASSLVLVAGSQNNYYKISQAGKFMVSVSFTLASSTGLDGSVGSIITYLKMATSVGNTVTVTNYNLRVTSVRR